MKILLESVVPPANASFILAECGGSQFGAAYHRHAEAELTAILAGSGRMVVGDCFRPFRAGDLVLQGGGLPHAYHADPGAEASALYLQFSPGVFGAGFLDLPECGGVRRLLERSSRGLLFSCRVGVEAAERMRAVGRETGVFRLAGLLGLLGLAASDSRAETLAGPGYAVPRPSADTTLAARILRLVDEHWRGGLPLAEAAAGLRMHPQTLSRHCKRYFKRGWAGLFIARRLSEAARMLIESDEQILAVSLECGFNSLSHFNRLFLRLHGMTPRAYRRRASGR